MTSKSKLTKLVAAAAFTITIATPLASTNTTLAMEQAQPDKQGQNLPANQATETQDSLMRQILDITQDQIKTIDRILRYLGIKIEPNKDDTVQAQQ